MSLGNYTGDLGGAAAPAYPAFYTRVTAGTPGGRSTLHAVLDYDDDEPPVPKGQASPYPLPSNQYSSGGGGQYPYPGPRGPVVVKNDSVAVVPLYSYGPTVTSNGSFVHIPVSPPHLNQNMFHSSQLTRFLEQSSSKFVYINFKQQPIQNCLANLKIGKFNLTIMFKVKIIWASRTPPWLRHWSS